MLNGLYGAQAKARQGPEGLAIAEANFKVSMIAEYFIYTIPVFGIGLVLHEQDRRRDRSSSQTWIWLSIVLYIVALGISHGVVIPTAKRMQVLMRELERDGPAAGCRRSGVGGHPGGAPAGGPPPGAGGPPPQVAELEALGKKIGAGRDAAQRLHGGHHRADGVEAGSACSSSVDGRAEPTRRAGRRRPLLALRRGLLRRRAARARHRARRRVVRGQRARAAPARGRPTGRSQGGGGPQPAREPGPQAGAGEHRRARPGPAGPHGDLHAASASIVTVWGLASIFT